MYNSSYQQGGGSVGSSAGSTSSTSRRTSGYDRVEATPLLQSSGSGGSGSAPGGGGGGGLPPRPRSNSGASSNSGGDSLRSGGGGGDGGGGGGGGSGSGGGGIRNTDSSSIQSGSTSGTGWTGGGSASGITTSRGRPPSGRTSATSVPYGDDSSHGVDSLVRGSGGRNSSSSNNPSSSYGNGGTSGSSGGPHRIESEVTLKGSGSRKGGSGGGGNNNNNGRSMGYGQDAADSSLGSSVSSNSRGSSPRRGGRGGSGSGNNRRSSQKYPQQQYASRSRQAEKRTGLVYTAIGVCFLAILLCVKTLIWPNTPAAGSESGSSSSESGKNKQSEWVQKNKKHPYDARGRFVLEDFDAKPPFSDFLPGVAGLYGKPVWSFYVNRGQCIASFGTKSKDFPIMEFNSANKAYQNTATLGFRTFLRITRSGHSVDAEPFSPTKTRWEGVTTTASGTASSSNEYNLLPKRYMYVGSNEMQIRETDLTNKIETNITYFTLPEEDFGSFVRRTTITNLDLAEPMTISMLDGLVRMEPAGGELDLMLKKMGRTLEGFFGVHQASMRDDIRTMPFYRMSTEATDSAAIIVQEKGHYALSFIEGKDSELLPIVYDTSSVFGQDTMFLHPVALERSSVREIINGPQYGHAKTSSAFAAVDEVVIPPGESITVASFYGKASDITDVPVIARRVTAPGFVQYKFRRAIELVNQITQSVETQTGNHLFNGHVQQMFLDNSLRGGIPIILGAEDDNSRILNADEDERLKVYHLFSRVHGDLERDYNNFIVEPTYFSEGPSNFRDVAQNRRNDVLFTPAIGSFHIKIFLSYIQADGYQPNSVEAIVFTIEDQALCDKLATNAVGHADGHRAQRELLSSILCNGPFRPGQLFLLIEDLHIELIMDRQMFIDAVAAVANTMPWAVFTHGYWADHWTYYLDLIQSYLSVYPENEEAVMYNEEIGYFFSPAHVRPRSEKYVLSETFMGKGKHVRQLEATVLDKFKQRQRKKYFNDVTGWYDPPANWQHDRNNNIFMSAPIEKLFLLATLKFATRDPYGMGIEYEAGKPGWNDAMNGLPGMVGSGMPETYELDILLKFVRTVVKKFHRRSITVPMELAVLINTIDTALNDLDDSGYVDYIDEFPVDVPAELFAYWDTVSTAREEYRESVKIKFLGDTREFSSSDMVRYLDRWIEQVEMGKFRAFKIGSHGDGDDGNSGIVPTYFSYNVTKWNKTGHEDEEHHSLVNPLAVRVSKFPLFLEGPTRMMKTLDDEFDALDVYKRVRNSPLRDSALGMYTISASLKGKSFDMGRTMAFSPGWLENQSVWLHMSYKFYLELLRHGLYTQFFEEMKTGMLPFMDSDIYGRSSMECSSFIASSAFEDPSQRGRGFLARLSGSTAEFLSMWVLMMIGPQPFFIDEDTNELGMQLVPALPLSLFKKDFVDENANSKGELTMSFKLFTSINVTYHNPDRRDLYGEPPKRYEVGMRDGSRMNIKGPTIPTDLAVKIRRVVFVDCIDAYF